jgi:methylated-DNA-protein-cysteine methyltransferase-like protein
VEGDTTIGMRMTANTDKRSKHSRWERVYAVVRRIPPGSVATYGQVARIAGLEGGARQVGYALHALPAGTRVPWHRVINSRGGISLHPRSGGDVTQRLLLEKEGVRFNAAGRTDLGRYGWKASGIV